jgi:hypothetical protein
MQVELLLFFFFSKHLFVSGCIGGASTPQSLASRNRALAAQNVDVDLKVAKCEVEHGIYRAKGIKRLFLGLECREPSKKWVKKYKR